MLAGSHLHPQLRNGAGIISFNISRHTRELKVTPRNLSTALDTLLQKKNQVKVLKC